MNTASRCFARMFILGMTLIIGITSSAMGDVSDKKETLATPGMTEKQVLSVTLSLRNQNLVIYASSMWLAILYDGQAKSLIATGSDRDGAVLWFARTVQLSEDAVEDTLTIKAVAVRKFGKPVWVDWQQFEITIDSSNHARIVKTNPNGEWVYKGRAVRIKTYAGDSDGH
jgi:hypothetical protein